MDIRNVNNTFDGFRSSASFEFVNVTQEEYQYFNDWFHETLNNNGYASSYKRTVEWAAIGRRFSVFHGCFPCEMDIYDSDEYTGIVKMHFDRLEIL